MSRVRIIVTVILTAVSLGAQDIDTAIRLFNGLQYAEAKEIFLKLSADPSNPRIAEVYYYLGRLTIHPDSSLNYYRRIIVSHPQSRFADIAYLEIAKIYVARTKYADAIVTLNELLKNYPETPVREEAMFWNGVSYLSDGQEETGRKILQDLLARYPKSVFRERIERILPRTTAETECYTVQVGSFKNADNAAQHVQKLKEQGIEGRVVEALVKNNTYYRVWIGRFDTVEEAKTYQAKLESRGIKGSVVRGY